LRRDFTTIFLDIPVETVRERILQRDPNTPEENIEKRIASMLEEKKKSEEICDYIIDATQTPEQVMQEVLSIIDK